MSDCVYPAWFFSPSEGQLVVVATPGGLVIDPDTHEVFTDLSEGDMRESDYWFEYPTRYEAMGFESQEAADAYDRNNS